MKMAQLKKLKIFLTLLQKVNHILPTPTSRKRNNKALNKIPLK